MASFVSSNLRKSAKKLNKDLDAILDVSKDQKIKATYNVQVEADVEELEGALELIDAFPVEAAKAFYFTMEIICNDLMAELDNAMEAVAWDWYGENRDIIDTRELQESGRCEFDPTTNSIVISYDSPYAEIVHFGGVISSPLQPGVDIVYPARPWVEAVVFGGGPVRRFQFQKEFNSVFFKQLEKNIGIKL
jgi:hypothetical protein